MKDLIYKFLDEYVGDGVVCKGPVESIVFRNVGHNAYGIYSKDGVLIFEVLISEDGEYFKFFCSDPLYKTVGRLFGVEEPFNLIRDWFGQKYGMNKVSDIMKFVGQPS